MGTRIHTFKVEMEAEQAPLPWTTRRPIGQGGLSKGMAEKVKEHSREIQQATMVLRASWEEKGKASADDSHTAPAGGGGQRSKGIILRVSLDCAPRKRSELAPLLPRRRAEEGPQDQGQPAKSRGKTVGSGGGTKRTQRWDKTQDLAKESRQDEAWEDDQGMGVDESAIDMWHFKSIPIWDQGEADADFSKISKWMDYKAWDPDKLDPLCQTKSLIQKLGVIPIAAGGSCGPHDSTRKARAHPPRAGKGPSNFKGPRPMENRAPNTAPKPTSAHQTLTEPFLIERIPPSTISTESGPTTNTPTNLGPAAAQATKNPLNLVQNAKEIGIVTHTDMEHSPNEMNSSERPLADPHSQNSLGDNQIINLRGNIKLDLNKDALRRINNTWNLITDVAWDTITSRNGMHENTPTLPRTEKSNTREDGTLVDVEPRPEGIKTPKKRGRPRKNKPPIPPIITQPASPNTKQIQPNMETQPRRSIRKLKPSAKARESTSLQTVPLTIAEWNNEDIISKALKVFNKKVFEKFGKGFISLQFSNQYPGSYSKMLIFKFTLPYAKNMADMTRLVALVPYYIDLIGHYKLSSQAPSKTNVVRSKAAQEAYTKLQNERREALQKPKEEKRRFIDEAVAKFTVEAIRKREEKELVRQSKKSKPRIKMMGSH
ncbi:hypothetical protein J5N97_024803 [Dioscorea zingiberensis]|uniref:Uncharacterized protein n=1 Tax=Dioscorea zingiberensis TaxID=325984 RepID=A0A9D5C751_9LILI|nr:hypothetical protein J5N97_024803 [Dioscorea zingiberensis]